MAARSGSAGEPDARGAAPSAAPVLEVFASIQGEGAFVGEPQVFLRLRGCPIRCRWCDTPGSLRLGAGDRARIATAPERGGVRREDPWSTPFQAACWIAEVEPGSPRTVSVTGGEPLLWPEFLLGLRSMLSPRRVHLETAGAHPRTLARVIDAFDHVSLDLKVDADVDAPVEIEVPSASGTARAVPTSERAPRSPEEWRAAREACLALVSGRDACGKIVVSGERSPDEIAPLLDEVERVAPGLTIYLQPATPLGGSTAPRGETLAALAEMARDRDLDVRVVPLVHRALGLP
jgi:organic radical activating enzyme